MLIAKRCLVAGRVQGVFYRASTQQKAHELSVRGYAKNLVDGRVEVLAVGEIDSVDALVKWLWQGSPTSHVTHIDVADIATEGLETIPTNFVTR
ncbi:MAG TPA: acylphosphatase [Steroidobacteraceae bacterium]|nr:acylphosphatase [Steroidobacteraceae bacterium]